MSFPVKALYGDQIRRFCLPHGAELSTALERVCGIFGLSERLTGLSVDDMEGGGSIFVNTDEQWHKAVRISLTKVPPLLRVRITETTGELHMKKATGELHEPTGELHEIDELKAELMALKRQITPLKKEKNTLKAERDALLGDKTLLETLTKAEKAKEEATAKLAEAEKRITEGWTERLKWKVVCQNMKAKLDDTVQTLEKEKAKLLATEAERQQLAEQNVALERKVAELAKTNSEVTAYVVMAYVVMAYIVMAYVVTAYVVTAYVVMTYRVVAYTVMGYIVMAYIDMACTVMALCSYGL